MTVSTETIRMAKSRPRKNQSERSDLPCYIIIRHIACARIHNLITFGSNFENDTKALNILFFNISCQFICSLYETTISENKHCSTVKANV